MRLDDGWNQIQFNLADFTRRAYGTNYVETLRVQESIMNMSSSFFTKSILNLNNLQWNNKLSGSLLQIHANCRIRRVYFSDRLYSEEELPAEFKLYLPVQVMINFRLDSSLNLLPRLKFLDNCVHLNSLGNIEISE